MQGFNNIAKRGVMLPDGAFKLRYLGCKLFVGGYGLPQPDKGADNHSADFFGSYGFEYAGKHKRPMFRERVWDIPATATPF